MIRERTHTTRQQAHERLLDPRLCALAFIAVVALGLLACARLAPRSQAAAEPQRRTQRRRPAAPAQRRPPIDYTKFSHATKGHYEDCASCHVTQTPVKFTLDKPDLREYPDHPACTECHRQQFFRGPFRGPAPLICAACHAAATPRNGARLPFPKPQQPSQFADTFPHANHGKSTSLKLFADVLKQTKVKQQDTCFYCHQVDKATRKAPAGAAADAFVPPPGTFMSTPTTHANCFQCHWQKGVEGKDIEPLANQCAECHQNLALAKLPAGTPTPTARPATPAARPTATPVARPSATPPAKPTPTPAKRPGGEFAHAASSQFLPVLFVPAAALQPQQAARWPFRTSPKFVHELDAHKTRADEEGKPQKITCLTCHAGVRTSKSLETLRQPANKVQLPACSSSACHTALSGSAALKLSIYRELRERGKDAKFDCATCHLPPVSLQDVPCDHYATVYDSAVKEKKSTKTLETLIPPRCGDVVKKQEEKK